MLLLFTCISAVATYLLLGFVFTNLLLIIPLDIAEKDTPPDYVMFFWFCAMRRWNVFLHAASTTLLWLPICALFGLLYFLSLLITLVATRSVAETLESNNNLIQRFWLMLRDRGLEHHATFEAMERNHKARQSGKARSDASRTAVGQSDRPPPDCG